MTSKVNNLSDQSYITSVLNKLEDRQKQPIILVDEVFMYLLLYHGGQLFGKTHNNEDELANAVLGIMIKINVSSVAQVSCSKWFLLKV